MINVEYFAELTNFDVKLKRYQINTKRIYKQGVLLHSVRTSFERILGPVFSQTCVLSTCSYVL